VPEPKNFLEQLVEQLSGGKDETGHISMRVGESPILKMAAPYLQNLDPRRTAGVLSALQRLVILQREGVALTMPELVP
jgi:ABC-type enterochelin transport system ATPase subunit